MTTTSTFNFEPYEISEDLSALRKEVRAFVAEFAPCWTGHDLGLGWFGFDLEFSRQLARRGWIGMTWPKQYGGLERSTMERYTVIEELMAAGAPLMAHWIAERQSGPLLLRIGTEAQRQRFLPLITRGEISFCIGLSEPDAGSDLAAIRSRATRVEGGWRLNGRKIWTTNAHKCQFMIALIRTAGSPETEKHKGLSQFLIDLSWPGVEVRPIKDLTGEEHFNEIVFEDVFIPEDMLVGQEGDGWAQANAELAFERSGPDRFFSSFPLLPAAVDALAAKGGPDRLAARRIGEAVAQLTVLRQMSLSIQGMLEAGKMPGQEAALVKQLGTSYEQRTPELVREALDLKPGLHQDDRLGEMTAFLTQFSPTFSLRGGAREILRGIIAKGLGLR
ncbi:MAG: acyl-CoA dehydrogenase family protein [Rhodocyclaceae bacterium]|jgi:alkylation response protein AidB-like acyl-CoA dehydrogenase|nr:acyl-CoA dehydrogenase family protein [Rhodocyclaceae bacterium]